MELTKKELIDILSESEVDEMAIPRKGVQNARHSKETGEKIVHAFLPHFEKDNNTEFADYWEVNPNKIKGEEIIVIPCDCKEVEEFMKSKGTWFKEIMKKHEKKSVYVVPCKANKEGVIQKWKYKPRGKHKGFEYFDDDEIKKASFDTSYKKSGKGLSLKTKLVKKLYNILYDHFGIKTEGGVEFNKELNKRSIPGLIFSPDPESQKFLDRTAFEDWSNDSITFRMLGFNSYATARDFLDCVIARISNDSEKLKEKNCENTFHMARQFSKELKWEEERPSELTWKGWTPKYKLRRQGYFKPDFNVTLKMIFEVLGERIPGTHSFNWTIRITNKFGKKTPTEYRIAGRLQTITWGDFLDNKPIEIFKTVQLDPNKSYDDENTIMDDIAVSQGLLEAIDEFKNKIKSINPKSALKIAMVGKPDVSKK